MDDVIYLEELEIYAKDEEDAKEKYMRKREEGEVKDMGREEFAVRVKKIETPKNKLIKEIDINLENFEQGYPDYTAKQKDIIKKMANLLQEAKIMIKHRVEY